MKYREGLTLNTDDDEAANICIRLVNMNGYSGSKAAMDYICQQSRTIAYLERRNDLLQQELDNERNQD